MKEKRFVSLILSLLILMLTYNVRAIESINTEIANAGSNEITITLDNDIVENVIIPEGKEVTINLANHKISSTSGVTITNNGELIIQGEGDVVGSTSYNILNHGSTITIKGGNYYYPEDDYTNGTFTCNTSSGKYTAGPSLISTGWATATDNPKADTDNPYSHLIIEGGVFNGGLNTIKNDEYGKLTIKGGTLNNEECKNSRGISNAVAILNGGKSLDISGNPTINGLLINQLAGVDKQREFVVKGGHIKQLDSTGSTSSITYNVFDLENVVFSNTANMSTYFNLVDVTLKNITATKVTISGKLQEGGTFTISNLNTPSILYALDQDYTFENYNLNILQVNAGSTQTVNIRNSKIGEITIGQSTTCIVDNVEGTTFTASSGTITTLNNSQFTNAVAGNGGTLTINNSTVDNTFAYYKNSKVTIASGTFKDVYAGYNKNKTVLAGIANIEINGGTFSGNAFAGATKETNKSILTINDGIFTGDTFSEESYTGTIIINGGQYKNTQTEKVDGFVSEGYRSFDLDADNIKVGLNADIHSVEITYYSPDGEAFAGDIIERLKGISYDVTDIDFEIEEGWRIKTMPENAKGVMADEDIQVDLRFSNDYTLTYVTNYEGEIPALTKEYGTKITLVNLMREGYRFDGWYKENTFENKILEVELKEDTTVYAKWTKKATLTIKYMYGEVELDKKNIDSYVGEKVEVPQKEFDLYYMTSKEVAEYTLVDGENILVIEYNKKVVLNYETNGAEKVNSVLKKVGEKVKLPEIEREGYRFDGWYKESTFENKISEIELKEDTTVYAKWLKECKVIVNYIDDKNNILTSQILMTVIENNGYKTEAKKFDGYTLTAMPENYEAESIKGDVTVFYRYKKDEVKEDNNTSKGNTGTKSTTNKVVNNTSSSSNDITNTEVVKEPEKIKDEKQYIVNSSSNDAALEVVKEDVKQLLQKIDNNEIVTSISQETLNELKEAIANNSEVKVDVVKKQVSENEALDAKNLIKVVSSDNQVVAYYDVSVELYVNNKSIGKLNSLSNNIQVSFDIPNNLPKLVTGYKREYKVYRIHDGKAIELKVVSNDGKKITVETNEFSPYVVTYRDIINTQIADANTNSKTDLQKFGLIIGVTLIVIVGGMLIFKRKIK